MYDALQRLSEAGLASSMIEDNKRWFIPTNPKKLPLVLEDLKIKQENSWSILRKDLLEVMPQLQAKFASIHDAELFEVYRGRKAFKSVLNEIASEKPKHWKGFGNLQVQEYFPIEFQRWFKGVTIRLFSTKTPEVSQRLLNSQKICNTTIHWLPSDLFMPVVWTIFGKNLLIIIYEPDVILLRITSPEVVNSFDQQFEYLWNKSKKD